VEAELDEVARHPATAPSLSPSRTLMNACPPVGIFPRRRATLRLDERSPNVSPTPITSPVDFISGPRIGSTPREAVEREHRFLDREIAGRDFVRALLAQRAARPCSAPAIIASGWPVAFET